MEIHKYELFTKQGFLKPKLFTLVDEAQNLVLTGKYTSIWKKEIELFDASNRVVATLTKNIWINKFTLCYWEGNAFSTECVIKSKSTIPTTFEAETHSNGLIRMNRNLMGGKIMFTDIHNEELAFVVRRMIGLRYHCGIAIKHELDIKFVAACLMIIYWKQDLGT